MFDFSVTLTILKSMNLQLPKINVLVVDDEVEIVSSLKDFLSDESFNVNTCTNADEALTYLKTNAVNVILSDISMPKKTGLEFYKEFKQQIDTTNTTPFVLMTGFADIISVENAFKMGVNELIAKPFDLQSISLVLNYLTKSTKSFGSDKEKYFPVSLEQFILSKTCDYDIYLRVADKYVKVTKSGQEFTAQRLQNFVKKGATHIYLDSKDFAKYTDLQFAIASTINSRPMDMAKKSKIMNHLMGSFGQNLLCTKMDAKVLGNAMSAFESYTQVALYNAEISNILGQLIQTSPTIAERGALRAMLCSAIAGMWKWNSAKIQSKIILAALMCDIGLKDNPQIMKKKYLEFTPKEVILYEQHPMKGFQMLSQIRDMPEEILQVALQHHENAAGLGFPQKLQRNKTHAYSKLVHGVDSFIDILYMQKKPTMIQEALDQLFAIQSKIVSEQVIKSLYLLFKANLPKQLNDLMLPSETSRVN